MPDRGDAHWRSRSQNQINRWIARLESINPTGLEGVVADTIGLTIAAADFPAALGASARIQAAQPLDAEVIGFRDNLTLLSPLGDTSGLRRGDRVQLTSDAASVPVGEQLLGRVLDARGRAADGEPLPSMLDRAPLFRRPPRMIDRPPIDQPMATGVRSVDALLTCGRGQRLGVFAGPGVGKSTLLGMIARNAAADVVVVALIGERGREVRDFVDRRLETEGMRRSVVVAACSDEPAPLRIRAAFTATAVAEYFRDQGANVLLVMDSITRLAQAQREIGLAAGEPPTVRGYPPSVFALLPKLVERAGRAGDGSITAFYSGLVEGDPQTDVVSEAVKSVLDGHLLLSEDLASAGVLPAVDVLDSVSRCMPDLVSDEHQRAATDFRSMLSFHREHRDLLAVGAYRSGGDWKADAAVALRDQALDFLRQDVHQPTNFESSRSQLLDLAERRRRFEQEHKGSRS
ncbi:MAG: FliI/YscN family ATPase [Planctomycetales bacterium]